MPSLQVVVLTYDSITKTVLIQFYQWVNIVFDTSNIPYKLLQIKNILGLLMMS